MIKYFFFLFFKSLIMFFYFSTAVYDVAFLTAVNKPLSVVKEFSYK